MVRPFDRLQRILDKPRFVQRVGVNRNLHVHFASATDSAQLIDGSGRGAPVFMQFEADGTPAATCSRPVLLGSDWHCLCPAGPD